MTVYELSREQIQELKCDYIVSDMYEKDGSEPSYGDFDLADELISDETIYAVYGDCYFVPDDFWCTSNKED